MLRFQLSIVCGGESEARGRAPCIALTAFVPDCEPSGCVIFASPGGGYGRGYYDVQFDAHPGYSQALHHCAKGHVVVAYDHLGVGDSSTERLADLTIEEIAAANHQAIAAAKERIREGSLVADLAPLPDARFIGIGQSMGGGVSIIMQARHRSFDAVGVLGYSALHTQLPQPTAAAAAAARAQYQFDRSTRGADLSVAKTAAGVSDFVYPFHWEDVPADIVEEDLGGGYPVRRTAPPYGSMTIPNCVVAMMSPGYVRKEAAQIDVPVFLGFGERDVSTDMRAEPSAFANAMDITLAIVPRMAHMHNFASTRARLWDRLHAWYLSV